MRWTRKKPIPPPRGSGSDWYWYWGDGEKEPWAVEIYCGCWQLYAAKGYWWTSPIPKPNISPFSKQNPKDAKKEELQQAVHSMLDLIGKNGK